MQLWFQNFQDGRPRRPYLIAERNDLSNSVFLNRSAASHRFGPILHGLGGDVVWRISRWPSFWISERNDFSNSESLCRSDASHQASAQSITVWEELLFKEFQDGRHLGYRNGLILVILNLYAAPTPPIKFRLNLTYGLGGDVVWRIWRWPPLRPS